MVQRAGTDSDDFALDEMLHLKCLLVAVWDGTMVSERSTAKFIAVVVFFSFFGTFLNFNGYL